VRGVPYTVVIPTKDRHEILPAAIRSLLAQTDRPRRVVVVDASDDPIRLDGETGDVELVLLRHAPSTSAQRNVGVAHVETPLVMFLDDDVELPPNYVETLKRHWARRGGLGALAAATGTAARPAPAGGRLGQLYRRAFQLHIQDPAAPHHTFRLSQKVRFRLDPAEPVLIPVVSTMAVLYRTDLARKHPFDEHFPGYALGEDLDMSVRVAQEAPILHVPDVAYVHAWSEGSRGSPRRWYYRGRCDTYFRLKRLDSGLVPAAAFALSVVGELMGAAADSARERDLSHVRLFVKGLAETLLERPRSS
jgi:glycosyltransferase involved in cell wall biosynthesis